MISTADIGSVHGVPIRAVIRSVNMTLGLAYVELPLTQSRTTKPVKLPLGWCGPRGQISGGFPEVGTNIFVVLGQGNEWMFVGYDQPSTKTSYDSDGTKIVSPVSKIKKGMWGTLVENDVNLLVGPNVGVIQGDSIQFTQADSDLGIWSSRFIQHMHFSDAHREVKGPILRDLKSNSTRGVQGSSLSGHPYNVSLDEIGLDPRNATSVSTASTRNPALAEDRKMYYEFVNRFGYTYDEQEDRLYAGEDRQGLLPYQRKRSRTDTMSLSLDSPNYLAESVIGTVVDIYGNILDINRAVLPSGLIDTLNFRKSEEDQNIVFRKLRTQLRKSIAYHFEINARKDGINLPDYDDTTDYAVARSRFFFDIDKEGQFKMNVPASSEEGNVSLLVRHENFSNIKGFEQDTDRGQFLRNITNNTDVQLEPHGKGVVSLVSNEITLKGFEAPLNRFDGEQIKLGTGYHEISNVLQLHKVQAPYSNATGTGGYDNSIVNFIDAVEDVVTSEVVVAGDGANAGGRSGTVSLDGMLSLSIGANTVDRQSLWLDTAGGIVGAIGRDKFQRSMALTLDGDLLMQVGGPTIVDDSRFPSSVFINEARDGVVDIRVWNSGSMHTIRIDDQGVKIHTPQRIDIVSEGEMRFKSVRSNMYFDAESIYFYANGNPANGRLVQRSTTGSAGKTI